MTSFSSVSTSSLIGVAIACSGNVLISLALTVQKLAHRRQRDELESQRSETSSPDVLGAAQEQETPIRNDQIVVPVLLVPSPIDEADMEVSPTNDAGHRSTDGQLRSMAQVASLDSVPENEGTSAVSSGKKPSKIRRDRSPGPIHVPAKYKSNIQIQPSSAPRSNGIRPHGKASENGKRVEESRTRIGSPSASEDGQDDSRERMEVEEGMYLKSKLWWLGLVLMAVGEGGNFLSYGFAPASVVAPLGTVALIANCLFAPLILRETFHAKELIGMALAIVGAVTVVYSSKSSNPRLDPDSLIHALRQIPFIVYTSLNTAFVIVLVLLARSPRWENRYIGIDVGICALFGGYTVLSTKALSSLLSSMFLDAFRRRITWGLVFVLVVTSILQVRYLNRALMRFQSKEVIPTQFVFFSLSAIIGSAVLYQEFRDVTFSLLVNFVFGIATTFLGVHLLTSFSEPAEETSVQDSDHPRRPAGPQRAGSSASTSLLLPSTSRLTERTPLLIPVTGPSGTATRPTAYSALSTNSLSTSGTATMTGRLTKRTSTSDFTPTLGLSSQAGFLLMATTPPTAGFASQALRRGRSTSRSQIPLVGDEERGDRVSPDRRTVKAGTKVSEGEER